MKRSLLSLSLICAAALIIGVGIDRETSSGLTRALKHFQAALPPGAKFTYRKVNPNFLVRGVTLHDVTFYYKNTHFHARSIRLGHPQFLPGGTLSLSSLLIKEPHYSTPELQISMTQVIFRHLLVPADDSPLINNDSDLTAASMHSLASLTDFNPDDLESLRFEWGHVDALHLLLLSPSENSHDLLKNGLGLHQLDTDSLTLEGYGLGGHVSASMQHVNLAITLNPNTLSSLSPIALPSSFFPATQQNTPLSYHLTLENLDAHAGTTHLLNHPFRADSTTSRQFWENPLNTLWQGAGTLNLDQLVFKRDERAPQTEIRLDNLIATRRDEGNGLDTEAMFKGFHLHLRNSTIPYPIHGTESTFRFSEHSHKSDSDWQSDSTGQLALPGIGTITLASHASLPEECNSTLLSHITLQSTTLSLRGDNLVSLALSLLPLNKGAPFSTKNDNKGNDVTQQRENVVHILNTLSITRPLLTPLPDYILNPQNRTLSITFGHFSLETLKKIPFSNSANALFDALHITAMNAQ